MRGACPGPISGEEKQMEMLIVVFCMRARVYVNAEKKI